MLVCLDMAKQVVTGNDSTGAFYKNFTYCKHFNCKPTKLLWIQTFLFYSLVNNFKHEYKRESMKRSKKVPVFQIYLYLIICLYQMFWANNIFPRAARLWGFVAQRATKLHSFNVDRPWRLLWMSSSRTFIGNKRKIEQQKSSAIWFPAYLLYLPGRCMLLTLMFH